MHCAAFTTGKGLALQEAHDGKKLFFPCVEQWSQPFTSTILLPYSEGFLPQEGEFSADGFCTGWPPVLFSLL